MSQKSEWREAIDEVKRRVSIVTLAEEAGLGLRQEGKCFKAFCPFHDDLATASLALYPDSGRWKCFGACQDDGDVIDFYRRLQDTSFRDAVEALAGKCGVTLPGPGKGRQSVPKKKVAPKEKTTAKAEPSAPAAELEKPPPLPGPIDLEDMEHLWPYDRAEAVYAYPLEGGGVAHEVRFIAKGRKRSVLCRPTQWGLIYGLTEGEYARGKDGCWRAVGPKTRPEAPRKQIAGARTRLYRPEVWQKAKAAGEWIFLVEGPKDAETGIRLGLAATTTPNGASGMKAHHADELRGCRVALVMDHDAAGEKGAKKRAKLLAGKAKEVWVLPALGGEPGSGYDLSDWVEEQKGKGLKDSELAADLLRRLENASAPTLEAEPKILITPDEKQVADEALAAVLAAKERLMYQRGLSLVQVVRSKGQDEKQKALILRPADSPVIRDIPEPTVREILSAQCYFVKVSEGKNGPVERQVHPPGWLSKAMLARGEWKGVPRLEGIVEGPVIRADGSVLQEPGYDEESGLLYLPSETFDPVPEDPSEEQVDTALGLLREVVCDFPFQTEAHFSAWLSALITPLVRYAFEGPSPLNLIDANIRGAGKSLLADVCAMIVTGRPAARMSYSRNEEESRKAITSLALSGTSAILIDNIAGTFGDATLDRALTATTWQDRLLGSNVAVELPLRATWYATGNNVILKGDTSRRCLHIRLESPDDHPEHRTRFRHPRLLSWIKKERHRILPASLTLLRAWWAAGRPHTELPGWGSYEDWSDLVRSCLVWLGLPDPAETRKDLEETADLESAALVSLVHGLEELLQTPHLDGRATAAEILGMLEKSPEEYPTLREALAELVRVKPGQVPTARQLGYLLRKHRGRYVAGASLTQASSSRKGVSWTVSRRGDGGDASGPNRKGGDRGDASGPKREGDDPRFREEVETTGNHHRDHRHHRHHLPKCGDRGDCGDVQPTRERPRDAYARENKQFLKERGASPPSSRSPQPSSAVFNERPPY